MKHRWGAAANRIDLCFKCKENINMRPDTDHMQQVAFSIYSPSHCVEE